LVLLFVFTFAKESAENFDSVFSTLEHNDEEMVTLGFTSLPPSGSVLKVAVRSLRLREDPCGETIKVLKRNTKVTFNDRRLRACGYIWIHVKEGNTKGWINSRYVNFFKHFSAKKVVAKKNS